MATKRNIARSRAVSKSFYQSTKSKRTRNRRHRWQDHRATKSKRTRNRRHRASSIEGKTTDPQDPHEHDRTHRPEPKTTIDPKTTKRPTQEPHEIHKDQKRAKWLVEPFCRIFDTQKPQKPQDPHSHVVLHAHVVI